PPPPAPHSPLSPYTTLFRSCLRTDRERHETASQRRGGAARGSPRPALSVPGVAPRTLERRARVAIAASARQLDHRELRREHGACPPEPNDRRRVLVDDLVAVGRRAPGGRRAARGAQTFGAVRDPGGRPAVLAT